METTTCKSIFFELMVANGGNWTTLAPFLRQAGYSESYARNPQKMMRTKAWKEFAAKNIKNAPDLMAVHSELLNATKTVTQTFPSELSDEDLREMYNGTDNQIMKITSYPKGKRVMFRVPDYTTRCQALDMAYKLSGAYPQKGKSL